MCLAAHIWHCSDSPASPLDMIKRHSTMVFWAWISILFLLAPPGISTEEGTLFIVKIRVLCVSFVTTRVVALHTRYTRAGRRELYPGRGGGESNREKWRRKGSKTDVVPIILLQCNKYSRKLPRVCDSPTPLPQRACATWHAGGGAGAVYPLGSVPP